MTLDVLNLTYMAKNKTVPSASEPINNCNKNGFCYIYSQCSHWDGEKDDKKEPNIIFVLPRLSAIQVTQQQIMTLYDIFNVAGVSLHP